MTRLTSKNEPAAKRFRRTQAERRALSEQRIINTAVRLFAKRGTAKTSLADIGEAAGYSRGLPAHLFGTKENLIVRLVQAIPRPDGLLEVDPKGGLPALLGAVARWFSAGARESANVRALLILTSEGIVGQAAREFPRRAAAVRALDKKNRDQVRRLLEAGIRRGEVRSDIDPDKQALLILLTSL
jgi:AcrR family transcriptional regulator